MALLLTMLPFYILGNLHCIGMCGPLVMMLGQHRWRYMYFAGRVTSFTLAGMLSGEIGAVFNLILSRYHISALTCFAFGTAIIAIATNTLMGWHYPGHQWLAKKLSRVNHNLSLLILSDQPWSTFLFGFFTVALPCGQTLIVFSACALSGDPLIGMLNGLVFALLTSPSLVLAMHTYNLFQKMKKYYNRIMGILGLLIGLLAWARGLAEMQLISHWTFELWFAPHYHIVIY